MARRYILLISLGLAVVVAGGLALVPRWMAARTLVESGDWYGFRLGMNTGAVPDFTSDTTRTGETFRIVPPWSRAYLSFDLRNRLVEIDLRDEGIEQGACQEAPCNLSRLKSVGQMRADEARILQQVVARLGPPSREEHVTSHEELSWDFIRPPRCTGVPPPPPIDPTGQLDSVTLILGDDLVLLDVRGHDWNQTRLPPGLPEPPTAPAPPAPPCPRPA